MKRLLVSILSLTFLGLPALAALNTHQLSMGAMLGDPTGISARYEESQNISYDAGLAYSFGTRVGTQAHGDYLITKKAEVAAGDTMLDFYYGIGARLVSLNGGSDSGKIAFGPRAPIGLRHELKDKNIEFFGDVALVLDIVPSTDIDLDLAVGIRYHF